MQLPHKNRRCSLLLNKSIWEHLRIILLILYTSTNLITFGQTFSIGRATKELWNPFDIKEIKDFEYHPISYHDSLVIKLEDINYLDTVSYKLFFTDSGYKNRKFS